ncbi:MAG: tetratricopeptide repeat protein [Bacteroidales bacterium]|nr:tetratricopeptide repeat protein [Bacteroidales bacterium]
MIELTKIEEYISSGQLDQAVASLENNIKEEPDQAQWHFLCGKVHWRLGHRREAITEYEYAAQLDPTSPAVEALRLTREIMDFFNPDQFNP